MAAEKQSTLIKVGTSSGESFEFDLTDLYHPQARFTPEEKISAAMAYVATGSYTGASRICGLEPRTIRTFKEEGRWWNDVYEACKKAKQEELDAMITGVIHKSIEVLSRNLVDGDAVFHPKTGEVVLMPVGSKHLATIAGILFDKRQLLRGEATSRSVSVSKEDTMKELQSKFQEMAERLQGKVVGSTEDAVKARGGA